MEGNNNNNRTNDTKLTKIFVGGLAWETQRDTMRRYFEQFGEIVEAVVITDKNTGRSKGYGFVTFKEAEAATRACQNMNPVIDGRRANCNLACLGAQKPRPPSSLTHGFAGTGRFRSPESGVGLVAPSPQFRGSSSSSSAFVHQNTGRFPFPYSPYGFSQDGMYPMNYYNHHLYGGQHISPYMGSSGGMFPGFYPYYPQYNAAQRSNQTQVQHHHHHQSLSFQYAAAPPPPPPPQPPLVQYPYLPHQQHLSYQQPPQPPILSLPTSLVQSLSSSSPSSSTSTAVAATTTTTKTVVITTAKTNEGAETSTKDADDDDEAITTSSMKIEG